jgi:hypothetical protein
MRNDQCSFCGYVKQDGLVKDGKFFCSGDHYDRFIRRHERVSYEKEFSYLEGWVLDSIVREGDINKIQNNRFFLLLKTEDCINVFTYPTKSHMIKGIAHWESNHGEGEAFVEGAYDKEADHEKLKYTAKMQITIEE